LLLRSVTRVVGVFVRFAPLCVLLALISKYNICWSRYSQTSEAASSSTPRLEAAVYPGFVLNPYPKPRTRRLTRNLALASSSSSHHRATDYNDDGYSGDGGDRTLIKE
jgi:hypothetical protein